MADGMTFEWHGMAELHAALEQLDQRVDRATAAAVKATAEAVQGASRDRIRNRSGRLAASVIVNGPTRFGFGDYEAQIGPSGVVYGRVVELGKKGRRHRKPHPYLEPGFREAIKTFETIFREHWGRAL